MSATLHSPFTPLTPTTDETLARLGFAPEAGGYRCGDLRFTIGPQWCVLETPAPDAAPVDDLHAGIAAPGLWKVVRAGHARRNIFSLPRRVWDTALSADADGEAGVAEQCVRWALDTAGEFSSSEWQAPSRALVESWFAPEQLTVLAGVVVRQGELICDTDRLAIRFPLVPEIPEDLPESRAAWLRLLLEEAQHRWHLVRLGFARDGDGVLSAVAEVDLTGVPHELAEDLFVLSLEALRWVVRWLAEPTDWLADVAVTSELLAVCPVNQP